MNSELYNEYKSLIAEANSYTGENPRLKDFRKLYCMAVFKSGNLAYANHKNLRVLTNQTFNKFVVDIVYIDAILDPNRQRRETKEFFEYNIVTRGMKVYAPPILEENVIRALNPQNINDYMRDITGYGTENVKIRDIIVKRRQEMQRARPLSEAERAFKEMFVAAAQNYNFNSSGSQYSPVRTEAERDTCRCRNPRYAGQPQLEAGRVRRMADLDNDRQVDYERRLYLAGNSRNV